MKIRFHAKDAEGGLLESTEWEEDTGHLASATKLNELRAAHGNDARISVERAGLPPFEKPPLFRYDIFLPKGTVLVVDEEGTHSRAVKNFAFHSRPFQEVEKDKVLATVQEQYPDAEIRLKKL